MTESATDCFQSFILHSMCPDQQAPLWLSVKVIIWLFLWSSARSCIAFPQLIEIKPDWTCKHSRLGCSSAGPWPGRDAAPADISSTGLELSQALSRKQHWGKRHYTDYNAWTYLNYTQLHIRGKVLLHYLMGFMNSTRTFINLEVTVEGLRSCIGGLSDYLTSNL